MRKITFFAFAPGKWAWVFVDNCFASSAIRALKATLPRLAPRP
jgi:hypothetical protein